MSATDFIEHLHDTAYTKALRESDFFLQPEVLQAIGTDKDYLAYLRRQACCRCGSQTNIEAAHVRRVAKGAGIGIKPEYSAIPLCHECHSAQHQKGESVLGGKDWVDGQARHWLKMWGHSVLRKQLGFYSLSTVEPLALVSWCEDRGLAAYLPSCFR